jgi:hypothetical protein
VGAAGPDRQLLLRLRQPEAAVGPRFETGETVARAGDAALERRHGSDLDRPASGPSRPARSLKPEAARDSERAICMWISAEPGGASVRPPPPPENNPADHHKSSRCTITEIR